MFKSSVSLSSFTLFSALVLAACGDAGSAADADAELAGLGSSSHELEQPVPPWLLQFANGVAFAVKQAQLQGSKNCGHAVPAVPVASVDEAWAKVRDYVTRVTGVKPGALKESVTACNLPVSATCANLFQNDLFHQDGRMGVALYPYAQQVDLKTKTDRVVIFTPQKEGISLPPVVVTAGVAGGWLMGLAYFDGRTTCE